MEDSNVPSGPAWYSLQLVQDLRPELRVQSLAGWKTFNLRGDQAWGLPPGKLTDVAIENG